MCTEVEVKGKIDWNIVTSDEDLRSSIRNLGQPLSFDPDSLQLLVETEEESFIGKSYHLTLQVFLEVGNFIAETDEKEFQIVFREREEEEEEESDLTFGVLEAGLKEGGKEEKKSAPYFLQELEDQSFDFGAKAQVQFPSSFDPDGDSIELSVEVSPSGQEFVRYETASQLVYIESFAPVQQHISISFKVFKTF